MKTANGPATEWEKISERCLSAAKGLAAINYKARLQVHKKKAYDPIKIGEKTDIDPSLKKMFSCK